MIPSIPEPGLIQSLVALAMTASILAVVAARCPVVKGRIRYSPWPLPRMKFSWAGMAMTSSQPIPAMTPSRHRMMRLMAVTPSTQVRAMIQSMPMRAMTALPRLVMQAATRTIPCSAPRAMIPLSSAIPMAAVSLSAAVTHLMAERK